VLALGWHGWKTYQAYMSGAPPVRHRPSREGGPALPQAASLPRGPLSDYMTTDTRRWGDVPAGRVICQDTPFECQGAIRLAGVRCAREGKRYPGAVLGVPVGRRGNRLHILQAVENWGSMPPRAPYGKIVAHYENGETRSFYFLFRVHGLDWFGGPDTPNETVEDPNTQLGWSARKPDGTYRRFFHTVFANPLPNLKIRSVDFISPLESANLWVFGFTIADQPAAPGPKVELDSVLVGRKQVAVRLVDSSDRPLPAATLAWRVLGPRYQISFPPFPADAAGQVMLDLPTSLAGDISLHAAGPGGLALTALLERGAAGELPAGQTLKLVRPAPATSGQFPLDLVANCNSGLTNGISMNTLNHPNNLGEMPSGEAEFGGIKFLVQGVIQTGDDFSARIQGLQVGRPCQHLHLLHGLVGTAKDGVPVGRLTLRYVDGSTASLDIVYGQHVRDWWKWQANEPDALAPGSAVAWTGFNADSRPKNTKIRVYRSTFQNPKPKLEIASLDFARNPDVPRIAPFLLGITLE
jgi:hypothetical protein